MGLLGAFALASFMGCSENSNPAETAEVVVMKVNGMFARTSNYAWHNNFAVEVNVNIEKTEGFIVLGNSGDWSLRVENGKPVFVWKDAWTDDQWYRLEADFVINTNEVVTIRSERADELTALYVNGQMVAAVNADERVTYLKGIFSIGFDPSSIKESTPGSVMFVAYQQISELSAEIKDENPNPVDPEDSSPDEPVEDNFDYSMWIAAWEFNDSKNVGRDFTGNELHDGLVYGSISVDGTSAHFDGTSGVNLKTIDDLSLETFAIETRVKPTQFTTSQYILSSRSVYSGPGWNLRIDNGTLVFEIHHDGESNYEIKLVGEALELNQWTDVRVEVYDSFFYLYQNGKMVAHAAGGLVTPKPSRICYEFEGSWECPEGYFMGVGFRPGNNDKFFVGDIDYVRFGEVSEKYDLISSAGFTTNDCFDAYGDCFFAEQLDGYLGNGLYFNNGILESEGVNGLYTNKVDFYKRNEFVVEMNVMPTETVGIQYLLAAIPENNEGDGWVICLCDGVLWVWVRDADKDGTNWTKLSGAPLERNKWTNIVVERTPTGVFAWQNGERTISGSYEGDISQLAAKKIGLLYNVDHAEFDLLNPEKDRNVRGFKGKIDFLWYYKNH